MYTSTYICIYTYIYIYIYYGYLTLKLSIRRIQYELIGTGLAWIIETTRKV